VIKREDRPVVIALFAIVLAVVVCWLVPSPSYSPKDVHAICSTHECREDVAAYRLALYTKSLAWFTAILALVSAAQGLLLIRAEQLTRRSIELARQEFIASHRPRLRMRLLTLRHLTVGQPIVFDFAISNVGDSPAMKVSYGLRFKMPRYRDKPIRWNSDENVSFAEISAGGQAFVTHKTDFICPADGFIGFTEGHLVVSGLITYQDANGIMRMTSFRRVHSNQGTFRQMEPANPDFEFEA